MLTRTTFTAMVVILIILAAGCNRPKTIIIPTPTPTPTTAPVTSPTSVPVPTATATVAPGTTATPLPTATATAVPVAAEPGVIPAFFLEVIPTTAESIVSVPTLDISGRTVADAVVTVNTQVAEIDASGNFRSKVSLQEGPNAISVVASDFRGRQESKVLTVIYVP